MENNSHAIAIAGKPRNAMLAVRPSLPSDGGWVSQTILSSRGLGDRSYSELLVHVQFLESHPGGQK